MGDDVQAWETLGFAAGAADTVVVGGVALRCTGEGGGVLGWVLGGETGPEEVDGIPTTWAPTPRRDAVEHPNGARSIDHVVVFTDSADRTAAALEAVDGDVRRRAAPPQVPAPMAFVRLGGVIVEVAEAGAPTRIWGLVAVVDDLDALVAGSGGRVGEPRAAVQPGRRIATARPQPGLETALAFMTPRPARA